MALDIRVQYHHPGRKSNYESHAMAINDNFSVLIVSS